MRPVDPRIGEMQRRQRGGPGGHNKCGDAKLKVQPAIRWGTHETRFHRRGSAYSNPVSWPIPFSSQEIATNLPLVRRAAKAEASCPLPLQVSANSPGSPKKPHVATD